MAAAAVTAAGTAKWLGVDIAEASAAATAAASAASPWTMLQQLATHCAGGFGEAKAATDALQALVDGLVNAGSDQAAERSAAAEQLAAIAKQMAEIAADRDAMEARVARLEARDAEREEAEQRRKTKSSNFFVKKKEHSRKLVDAESAVKKEASVLSAFGSFNAPASAPPGHRSLSAAAPAAAVPTTATPAAAPVGPSAAELQLQQELDSALQAVAAHQKESDALQAKTASDLAALRQELATVDPAAAPAPEAPAAADAAGAVAPAPDAAPTAPAPAPTPAAVAPEPSAEQSQRAQELLAKLEAAQAAAEAATQAATDRLKQLEAEASKTGAALKASASTAAAASGPSSAGSSSMAVPSQQRPMSPSQGGVYVSTHLMAMARPQNLAEELEASGADDGAGAEQSELLEQLFKSADKDGSGQMDAAEITKLFTDRGFDLSAEELEQMLSKIDRDKGGSADIHEFIAWMKSDSVMAMKLRRIYENELLAADAADGEDEHEKKMREWIVDTERVLEAHVHSTSNLERAQQHAAQQLSAIASFMDSNMDQFVALQQLTEQVQADGTNGRAAMQEDLDVAKTDIEEIKEAGGAVMKATVVELKTWRDEYVTVREEEKAEESATRAKLKGELEEMRAALELAGGGGVDDLTLQGAIADISAMLMEQLDSRASKADMARLQNAIDAIGNATDTAQALEAVKEGLFLVESRVMEKADKDDLGNLKRAMRRMTSLRSQQEGALTVRPVSMCLACNRPVFQAHSSSRAGASTSGSFGGNNTSGSSERFRQKGLYRDSPSKVNISMGSSSLSVNDGTSMMASPARSPTPHGGMGRQTPPASPIVLPSLVAPRSASRGR